MAQTPSELIDWINEKLNDKNWSQNELARKAGVTSGVISLVMTGTRPGIKVCKAIANAFGVSEETVLKLAGHLEKERGYDVERDELNSLFDTLPEEKKSDLLDIARTLGRKGKGKK